MSNRFFYCKLAASSIGKNSRSYIPYLITCTVTVAMFYMIFSLSANDGVAEMRGGPYIQSLMALGSIVTGLFAVIFLFYTHSFLIKQRRREFGLYNILGLEKKHIMRVVAWETLYLAAVSLSVGLGSGILLDKLMYLILARLLGDNPALGFYISAPAIIASLCLFGTVFVLTLASSAVKIGRTNPVELLHSHSAGEREPRAKWLIALMGVVTLGAGYYISIVTEDPVSALTLFFVAVILVIVGTYLLFTAGSIAVLKLLRKNKRFYYKPEHFINVSGMMFRMKQNAVGLANICILSTMVLVMLSTTTSLWIGLENQLESSCPRNIIFKAYSSSLEEAETWPDKAQSIAQRCGSEAYNPMLYEYLDTFGSAVGCSDGEYTEFGSRVLIVTVDDYNRNAGTNYSLSDGEALIYSSQKLPRFDTVAFCGETYKAMGFLKKPLPQDINRYIESNVWLVVPSRDDLVSADSLLKEDKSMIDVFFAFDVDGGPELQNTVAKEFSAEIFDAYQRGYYCSTKGNTRENYVSLYGGLFFIGIFLSTLFLMAAILIIYYKQISEGLDDKRRFEIMQNVGLGRAEVKRSINSQILIVFFLPLVVAGIHLAFSFPIIRRLFVLVQLSDATLFAVCMLGCFLLFAVLYRLIFSLTAKVYYRIVSGGARE